MNIDYPSGRASFYLDRNPSLYTNSVGTGAVAPHAFTNRIQRTIPAGRRGLVTVVSMMVVRATAPTTPSIAEANLWVNVGGAGVKYLYRATVYNATVGASINENIPAAIWLSPADIIGIDTHDQSTAGTVIYEVALQVLEFDA